MHLPMHELEDEDLGANGHGDVESEGLSGEPGGDAKASSGSHESEDHQQTPGVTEDGMEEGMLPRDLPKRTAFYDPIAERQMTQTDVCLLT
jgi:AMP deaminase